jgi:hypothetical protein
MGQHKKNRHYAHTKCCGIPFFYPTLTILNYCTIVDCQFCWMIVVYGIEIWAHMSDFIKGPKTSICVMCNRHITAKVEVSCKSCFQFCVIFFTKQWCYLQFSLAGSALPCTRGVCHNDEDRAYMWGCWPVGSINVYFNDVAKRSKNLVSH